MHIHIFKNDMVDHMIFFIAHTVSTHIEGRRSIFVQGFLSGGIFKFCTFLPQKVDFWAKKWRFIQSGTLIKSGVVFMRIRYVREYIF